MAKPVSNTKHPWQTVKQENSDFSISVLTGFYKDGTKEKTVVWSLNFIERLKVLFCGKVVLHCINTLPLHTVSTDYKHLQKMSSVWNEALQSAPEEVKELIKKHYEAERSKD